MYVQKTTSPTTRISANGTPREWLQIATTPNVMAESETTRSTIRTTLPVGSPARRRVQ